MEELPEVQRALGRLTPREAYDRVYRMKVSLHASTTHKDLPKEKWVSAKDDVRYLKPHIESVIKEDEERAAWDNMTVHRK
ncbi:cytochrome b-c1 complex subunit 7 [Butyriboletus roseoflavus]|nr:cytochrome b-c1 complex subunit 7 [Butyriboletus roseoflavus]